MESTSARQSSDAAVTFLDLDLATPDAPLPEFGGDRVWALVRYRTEPLGVVELTAPPGRDLRNVLLEEAGRRFAGRATPDLAQRRAAALAAPPRIAAVVCTRDNAAGLRTTLRSLAAQEYPDFAVHVIDNAPADTSTRDVVAEFRARTDLDLRYTLEPAPGLSRARNRAIGETTEAVVAWIDDDEVADPWWLAEIARALHEVPEADAVTGLILPAELRTTAQEWFEAFGGHSKGRGFVRHVFGPRMHQSPLVPLPAFGAGGNMAFRRRALERIGGFDNALGSGTRTQGAEDTKAFTLLLLRGGTIVYQPTALVRHFHRPSMAALENQLRGYGKGLTAFYTSLLLDDPRLLWPLARVLPGAAWDAFAPGGRRKAAIPAGFPRALLKVNRDGMLRGPGSYLAARVESRARA